MQRVSYKLVMVAHMLTCMHMRHTCISYNATGEAVHVIREGALVKKLWRGSAVVKGDAYEAGLYTLRPSMFGVLEKLEVNYMYLCIICLHTSV
jgi:hypothetical protein